MRGQAFKSGHFPLGLTVFILVEICFKRSKKGCTVSLVLIWHFGTKDIGDRGESSKINRVSAFSML